MDSLKDIISYDDFSKVDIRSATIIEAEVLEKSDKLIKLTLDVGGLGKKTVLAGIKEWYFPGDLKGKQTIYLANLEPRKMMGEESQGMLLALDSSDEKPILLLPSDSVDNAASVR